MDCIQSNTRSVSCLMHCLKVRYDRHMPGTDSMKSVCFFWNRLKQKKSKKKQKKKEEEAVFWQTAEPTGIIISNRNYKEELKEVKSLNNAKRLTHVNRWSDGLKTGPDECLFFFSSLSSSTSTTHCLLKMSADLAKLEQHLATRSYVEG